MDTVSGYRVTLRPWISLPKYYDIQSKFAEDIMVDPKNPNAEPDIKPFSLSSTYDTQQKLMRYLIIKITKVTKDANGVETEIAIDNSGEDYLPIPPEDAVQIAEVITEISNKASETFNKKK